MKRQFRGMATSVSRPFEAEVAALDLAHGLAVQPEHYALYVVRLEIFASFTSGLLCWLA